uniref:Uncharacterized protein n=1 Tax=Neobodo designis TaxID=312471 RepID=A0A7S1QHU3_NEODS|mmetsp:Transcript_45199/g.139439  ORF Transcript_45199/g.139439 Transcript_45199/m.139439 type:complete len:132 (+) Transcript_45199:29-424(+)
MELVQEFLRARAEKRGDDAAAMLHDNASLGTVWGYHTGTANFTEFLKDEPHFTKRGYLKSAMNPKITKIDDNTFMRTYHFNRWVGLEQSGTPIQSVWPHKWRETFFVKDNKLALVTCSRQPTSVWDFFLFN